MITDVRDKELNNKLHELYLKSKHWIVDLDLLAAKLDRLNKLYGKAFNSLIETDNFDKVAQILLIVSKIQKEQTALKTDICNYLQQLELLIGSTKQPVDFNLISTHTQLELKIIEILLSFQSVKNMIYCLTKSLEEHTSR